VGLELGKGGVRVMVRDCLRSTSRAKARDRVRFGQS
jgi:hypothetical protein